MFVTEQLVERMLIEDLLSTVGRLEGVQLLREWVHELARGKASLMQEWTLTKESVAITTDRAKFSWHDRRKYVSMKECRRFLSSSGTEAHVDAPFAMCAASSLQASFKYCAHYCLAVTRNAQTKMQGDLSVGHLKPSTAYAHLITLDRSSWCNGGLCRVHVQGGRGPSQLAIHQASVCGRLHSSIRSELLKRFPPKPSKLPLSWFH
jgi:hypothetical protein